jgi:hypothetical protein
MITRNTLRAQVIAMSHVALSVGFYGWPASGLLVNCSLLLCVCASGPTCTAENLFRNPGFKQASPDWYPIGPAKLTITDQPRRTGAHALRVGGRTAVWHGVAQDLFVKLSFEMGTHVVSA